MAAGRFINVIIPLKLGWEPFYRLDEGENPSVGDWVAVSFAGRKYEGVVSAVSECLPEGMQPSSLRPIFSVHAQTPPVSESEIAFWRKMAEYYMCTVGEVFKAAYPPLRKTPKRPRKAVKAALSPLPPLPGNLPSMPGRVLSAGKTVLLSCPCAEDVLLHVCRGVSGTVLWLVPEQKNVKALKEKVASVAGNVILGNRSQVLHRIDNLSMIIVQDEHEASYKQSSPAPRYNARDAAIMLGALHGVPVVLESATPSLESLYNCMTGKYLRIDEPFGQRVPKLLVVDTRAEKRKRGMVGEVSRKMIECGGEFNCFYKPRRAAFPSLEELSLHIYDGFGYENSFITDDIVSSPIPPQTQMLGIFGVDALLGRADFRADERAVQVVRQAVLQGIANSDGELGTVVVQTREPSHPVFSSLERGDISPLLEERRLLSLPPFTRLVDILVRDSVPARRHVVCERLHMALSSLGLCAVSICDWGLRLTFPRDKSLLIRKTEVFSLVESFEKEMKYVAHIAFDVDPQ